MRSLFAYLALPLLSLSLTFATACTDDPTAPPIDDRIVELDVRAIPGPDAIAEGEGFVLDLAALGQACGARADGAACPTGLTCVSYRGVAGPAVEEFSTCELPCHRGAPACPSGTACIDIHDGPGLVCEPVR